ncbi:hypothetical protein OC845_006524 [Tilletia horrida]|nr:hypothetical protein OC845_006524 [Tilletia horrida]
MKVLFLTVLSVLSAAGLGRQFNPNFSPGSKDLVQVPEKDLVEYHPPHHHAQSPGSKVAPYIISADQGACGFKYNATDFVGCLSPGWAKENCGKIINVRNPATSKNVDVIFGDTCTSEPSKGDPSASTTQKAFTCGDIALSEAAYKWIGGDVQQGTISNQLLWYFKTCECLSEQLSFSPGI